MTPCSPLIGQDTVAIFAEMYRHHLNQLLEAVTNLNFASIQHIWLDFWSLTESRLDQTEEAKLPMSKAKLKLLLTIPELQSFIQVMDCLKLSQKCHIKAQFCGIQFDKRPLLTGRRFWILPEPGPDPDPGGAAAHPALPHPGTLVISTHLHIYTLLTQPSPGHQELRQVAGVVADCCHGGLSPGDDRHQAFHCPQV